MAPVSLTFQKLISDVRKKRGTNVSEPRQCSNPDPTGRRVKSQSPRYPTYSVPSLNLSLSRIKDGDGRSRIHWKPSPVSTPGVGEVATERGREGGCGSRTGDGRRRESHDPRQQLKNKSVRHPTGNSSGP